jgi:ATP/maltotriose-dependent transcriptional regulator MalT
MFGFGGLREMRQSAAEAARLEDNPASAWYALGRAAWGWSLYLSGQAEQAQVRLLQAVLAPDLPQPARMLSLSVMALMALDTGQVAKAEALAGAARDMTAADSQGEMPAHSALAHTAAGAVYARQGHPQKARREFDRALDTRLRWVAMTPWMAVEAQLRLTAAMFELGDREMAVALLEEAGDLLSTAPAGAGVLRARMERLGQRFAVGQGAPQLSELLTEQERRILGLLPGTLSRREIATELHVSMNTVKTHIRMIYRKLGTRSRQETVRRARVLGLMSSPRAC